MTQAVNPGISLAGAVDLSALKHKVEATPGQAGGAPAASGYVIDVTESSFQSVVGTSATFPILLLLWVPTDDRLIPLAGRLGEAVNALEGKMQLARVDIASYPSIAQALRVQGAPALFGLIAGRPMPILQGLPSAQELDEVIDSLLPQLIALADKAGVNGTAPLTTASGDGTESAATDDTAAQIPPAHAQAHALAEQGDYAAAAAAYQKLLEADPHDNLAAQEQAKAALLARSASADVRAVRQAAADRPDSLDAVLAAADVDMIDGHVEDAFARLLDFAAAHRADLDPVRERLLSYFPILASDDPRLKRARIALGSLLY